MIRSKAEKLSDGNYLIDSDRYGTLDYDYNPASDETSIYHEQPIADYMRIAIVFIAGLILFFVVDRKRKRSRT